MISKYRKEKEIEQDFQEKRIEDYLLHATENSGK
jgi:hypothetical protein